MARPFTVSLFQTEPTLGDKEANLAKMERRVQDHPADLCLFPELYLTGYMCRDAFPKLGEPLDGPSVRRVRALAAETGGEIAFGMPERDPESELLFNSAVHVSPGGDAVAYRKLYPANFGPFEELQYFARGQELTLVDSDLARIGLLICYDTFFPEVPKALALQGAEVLACVSAGPATSKPLFDRVIPARAIENTCFFLYSNLVGTELNMVFQGGTQAVGPRGEELGRAADFEEGVITCEVDPRDTEAARVYRPTVRDTRPEVLDLLRASVRGRQGRPPGTGEPEKGP